MLARETSLVVVAGLAAARAVAAAVPATRAGTAGAGLAGGAGGRAVAWQLVLLRVWGVLPVRSGGTTSFGGQPVLGVLDTLAAGVPGPTVLTAVVTAERVGVLALFGYAAVGPGHPPGRARPAARRSPGRCPSLMALAVAGWTSDVQFLRAANEAIGLSVLVALADRRSRSGRWALLLAAAMTCGVALEYALRQ